MKLIDNWKQSYKLKSVQIGALSAIFFALSLFSEHFLTLWNVIPKEVKNSIPEQWKEYVGAFVGVAMILARLKKQPSLHPDEQLIQPMVAIPRIGLSKKGFDLVREKLFKGKLTQAHVDNINAILNAVSKYKISDLQQIAYLLATAYHETNATMQPVREAYWLSEDWRKKNLRYFPWYGRGHVQLTWEVNYQKADQKLGLGGKLLKNPDLAMQSAISAEVLVLGSKEGWFTTKKLDDYINLQQSDYVNARRIINGNDKDQLVADYAKVWEDALDS